MHLRFEHLSRVSGPGPAIGLEALQRGVSKVELLAVTSHVIGVRDVSLAIERGELFVLMGLSGSGNSTLARLINRRIEPDEGRVLLDGVDVTALSNRDPAGALCIAVMAEGEIRQAGTPAETVGSPADDYVPAWFRDVQPGHLFTAGDIAQACDAAVKGETVPAGALLEKIPPQPAVTDAGEGTNRAMTFDIPVDRWTTAWPYCASRHSSRGATAGSA